MKKVLYVLLPQFAEHELPYLTQPLRSDATAMKELGLKPIKTLPIREKIAANLREAILSKKIPTSYREEYCLWVNSEDKVIGTWRPNVTYLPEEPDLIWKFTGKFANE